MQQRLQLLRLREAAAEKRPQPQVVQSQRRLALQTAHARVEQQQDPPVVEQLKQMRSMKQQAPCRGSATTH